MAMADGVAVRKYFGDPPEHSRYAAENPTSGMKAFAAEWRDVPPDDRKELGDLCRAALGEASE